MHLELAEETGVLTCGPEPAAATSFFEGAVNIGHTAR